MSGGGGAGGADGAVSLGPAGGGPGRGLLRRPGAPGCIILYVLKHCILCFKTLYVCFETTAVFCDGPVRPQLPDTLFLLRERTSVPLYYYIKLYYNISLYIYIA